MTARFIDHQNQAWCRKKRKILARVTIANKMMKRIAAADDGV